MLKAAELTGESATVSALTAQLELPQTAVTELVNRAEQAGLVQRQRAGHDRRVRAITLTPEGNARLMEAFTSMRDGRAELALTLKNLNRSFHAILRTT